MKGRRVIQRAFALLERSPLHFIGNIEPQELFSNRTDAVICDGFVGNIVLKMYEGLMETLLQCLTAQLPDGEPEEVGMALGKVVQQLQDRHDYRHVGGAPLLGVQKPVIAAHGRSHGEAMSSAILLASRLVGEKVYDRFAAGLEEDGILIDLKHQNTTLMLDLLRVKWGFSPRPPSGDRK